MDLRLVHDKIKIQMIKIIFIKRTKNVSNSRLSAFEPRLRSPKTGFNLETLNTILSGTKAASQILAAIQIL